MESAVSSDITGTTSSRTVPGESAPKRVSRIPKENTDRTHFMVSSTTGFLLIPK